MEYRALGNTGLEVSVIGMGCEGFVDNPADTVEPLMRAALRQGINFLDLYTPSPEVHRQLSGIIDEVRDKIVIQGHICSAWENGQYLRTRSMDKVKASFETQLENLGTDYLDIGMIHYVDAQADYDEVFNGPIIEYVQQLKRDERIRHIGLSSHNPAIALQAVKSGLIDTLMFSINPAYDLQPATENIEDLFDDGHYEKPLYNVDAQRDHLYKLCEARGVGISVMKAFAGGRLLDAKRSQFGCAMTPVQCVHYALTRPGVVSVLAGFHTVEQFDETCAWCNATDTQKDYGSVLSRLSTHTFNGECMYCGHCAPCTVGIDIANANKFADLAEAEGRVTETLAQHYAALDHHAGECIGCGDCESNCPFDVRIVDKMEENADLFGF